LPSEIKVAVLGCGKQAPKHISGLRTVPGVQLVLADVCGQAACRLAEKEKVPWVERPDDVFSDDSIDAVDICTPTPSHIGLIRAAIRSGKDFFCEKPLCESSAEAHEVAAELQCSRRIGMVGYVYRFAPVFETGCNLLKGVPARGVGNVLGPIRLAHFRIGGRGSHQLWKHRRATGGGAANEMLVHMLDLAIWYFGPAIEARVLGERLLRPCREIQGRAEEVDAEDFILVELVMNSGVAVICQADMLTPAFTQFVEIQGDNGTFMGSIDPEMPSFVFLNKETDGWAAGRTPLNFPRVNLFEAQMSEFVRAVQTRTAPSRCTIEDSLLLLESMEMLRKSRD
jgi:myo-inositol 2-dehydrogenase/D-chiro-inositol 1-dehydrogenase